jgi:hypothetical protein
MVGTRRSNHHGSPATELLLAAACFDSGHEAAYKLLCLVE